MRKLIAVGVLVGGLLAGAGSAMAAPFSFQGGIGDPLSLAASGVLIPYITGGPSGPVALIEIASPVGPNGSPSTTPPLHLIFYNNTCVRAESVQLPESTNDIAFVNPSLSVVSATNGLVAIGSAAGAFDMQPLFSPIHTRVYLFNPASGRSRVLEPIILDTAEFGVSLEPVFGGFAEKLWSPLRTAATFYAPFETATVKTELTLICPRQTIQGAIGAAFGTWSGGGTFLTTGPFSSNGFPVILPAFPSVASTGAATTSMRGVVYDTNELFIADVNFTCDCLNPDLPITAISPAGAYSSAGAAFNGTFTEIEVAPGALEFGVPRGGSFTGYKASFTVGSPLNNFFGRLSNGSRPAINGIYSPLGPHIR